MPSSHHLSHSQGLFISLEGIDGSGKSLQTRMLCQHLQSQGCLPLATREPTDSSLGQQARQLLFSPQRDQAKAYQLFLADRLQHQQQVILPALAKQQVVVCDRFHDSTLAYQSSEEWGPLSFQDNWTESRFGLRLPDITLWLDIAPEECQQRLQQTGMQLDDFERNLAFQQQVAGRYRGLWQQNKQRIQRVDAQGDSQAVAEVVWQLVQPKLEKWRLT